MLRYRYTDYYIQAIGIHIYRLNTAKAKSFKTMVEYIKLHTCVWVRVMYHLFIKSEGAL